MICPERERLNSNQVLDHPFLTKAFRRHPSIDDSIYNNQNCRINNLKEYRDSTLMQRMIYTALSQRLTYDEINNLHDIFIQLDKDNDGQISKREFSEGIKILKLTDQNNEQIQDLFKIMDTNNNKNINYSEFIAASLDKKFYFNQEKLLEVFESFDTTKDGKISYDEFKSIISSDKKLKYESFRVLRKEFEEVDKNKDGMIDYNEFVMIISKKKDQIIPKKESYAR